MPIRTPADPARGPEVIGRAISLLSEEPTPRELSSAWGETSEGTLGGQTAAPHPVFVANLRDLADGRLLADARPGGWRYLVVREDQAVGSATVRLDDSGEVVFSHVTQGPYVASTVEGIRRASGLPAVAEADFDLRLVILPALELRALWLHGDERDLLVPLEPAPETVEAYRVYSEQELVEAVHGLALARLASDDDEAGG